MKIVNEKGKLFGIINLVDLLVLLAVLVVAAGVIWRTMGSEISETVNPPATVTYEVRARALQARMQPEIDRLLALDTRVIAGSTYVDGARILSVRYEKNIATTTTAEGRIVEAEDPSRVDAIFTLEAKVDANAPVIKVGTQEVRAGISHYVKTRYFECNGPIEKVTVA